MSDDKNNDLDISLDFVPRDYEDRMENAKKTGKRIGAKPRLYRDSGFSSR